MNPREFEELVCEHFRKLGYKAETTAYSGDYGIDVFATKGTEKLAIQAKMYGNSTRKVNRQMVMELHGAKDYFDCTKAVIATDGAMMPDAKEVAEKLKIEVLNIYPGTFVSPKKEETKKTPLAKKNKGERTFEGIWEDHIMPLAGKTISRGGGTSNKILTVDWSGVERISSKGNKGKIKIEIFRQAVNKLLAEGYISRDEINQNYPGRASSGVVLILSAVPFFTAIDRPSGLRYGH